MAKGEGRGGAKGWGKSEGRSENRPSQGEGTVPNPGTQAVPPKAEIEAPPRVVR